MSKGMKKNFGGGENIDILKDPWIVDPLPRPPKLKLGVDPALISIGRLKRFDSDEWHLQNLKNLFGDSEAQMISKTFTVASSISSYSYSWIHNKNGNYSVKSGYWLWSQHSPEPAKPNLSPLYEALWKVKAPPKIQHFLWRCLSGGLAVGEKLATRRLLKDPDCPRCGIGVESINHALFECGFGRLVWTSSAAGFIFYPLPSRFLFSNLASCLFPLEPDDPELLRRIRCWSWLLWRLWKARNDLCFQNRQDDVLRLVQLAEEDARGWDIVNSPSQVPCTTLLTSAPGNRSPTIWQKPAPGNFKCNIDGSWKAGSDTSGVGWVIRDASGKVCWYGLKSYPALDSPLETEAAALVWALKVVDNLNF